MPMAVSTFFRVAVFLDHFRGDDPHAHGVGQDVEQPDERLFEDELHRIAVHHLHPVHGVQQLPLGIAFERQEAVEGKFHVLGHQLAPVDGWLIVPFDALAQMEDIGRVVRRFPAFRQIRLDDEGARRHIRADFVPQELAVDEAQRGMRLEVARQMRIEVHRDPSRVHARSRRAWVHLLRHPRPHQSDIGARWPAWPLQPDQSARAGVGSYPG